MKNQSLLFVILIMPLFLSLGLVNNNWTVKKQDGYALFYTALDQKNIDEYGPYFVVGKKAVYNFFESPFKTDFGVYIHASRASLDSAWQNDWQMPGFNSQCWMVASGVAKKLDIISPKLWDSLACEHSYSDSIATQQLITHELVHVYHGQHNKSPDFNNVSGIDWFVEGLAVYASGQCDTERVTEVQKAVKENSVPDDLGKMWSGNLKYGQSGTLVMYIDHKYGREKLIGLLQFNNIEDLLKTLNTTESELTNGWKEYMSSL